MRCAGAGTPLPGHDASHLELKWEAVAPGDALSTRSLEEWVRALQTQAGLLVLGGLTLMADGGAHAAGQVHVLGSHRSMPMNMPGDVVVVGESAAS